MLDVDDLVGATRGADNLAVVVEVAGVAFLRGDSFVGRAGFTSLSLISPGSLLQRIINAITKRLMINN